MFSEEYAQSAEGIYLVLKEENYNLTHSKTAPLNSVGRLIFSQTAH